MPAKKEEAPSYEPNFVWVEHGMVAASKRGTAPAAGVVSGDAGYFDADRVAKLKADYGDGCLVPVAEWAKLTAEQRAADLERRRQAHYRPSVARPTRVEG